MSNPYFMPLPFHCRDLGKWTGDATRGSVLATLSLAASLTLTGCGKSQSTAAPPAPPETNAAPPSATSGTPAAAPVQITASPNGGADLKQLNHAYVTWIVQHRQAPRTFEEFIKLSGMQVPPPPAGKKYVIDRSGFINYADK